MIKKWLLIGWLACFVGVAHGAIDVYDFETEEQRHRYQYFLEELRCPKCKNNNLAGTNSQIAEDLRRELHKMVTSGKTDEEIIDFMVTRYGDFVLYRPPVQSNTMVLWLGPIFILLIGVICILLIVMRKRKFVNSSEELTDEEKNQLDAMLSTANSSKNSNKN